MDTSPLPDTSNLFGSLGTTWPAERVAQLFAYRGWELRKCSWTDYEVTSGFAELVIEASSSEPGTVLIHGAVADVLTNLPEIANPLAAAGISYSFECYDTAFALIHHTRG